MRHVFVSYVRDDQQEVDAFCAELARSGVLVWLDRNGMKPGANWKDAIREAIQAGAFFIACFSDAYLRRAKSYMNEEVTLAIEELRQYPTTTSWFIRVLLSDCQVPDRRIGAGATLQDLQWAPLNLARFRGHLTVGAIEPRRGSPRAEPQAAIPDRVPG